MKRLVLALTPLALLAQFELSWLEDGRERPASGMLDLGAVDTFAALEASFRARNVSASGAVLETLSVAGTAFSLKIQGALPATVPAGGVYSFTVRFAPTAPGTFSAVLTLNSAAILLRATALPAPILRLEPAGQRLILADQPVDFGSLERGAALSLRFLLENPHDLVLPITQLTVSGTAFRGPEGLSAPLELAPHETAAFQVVFAPLETGAHQGRLWVNNREVLLRGQAVEPPLPQPLILVEPTPLSSGRQAKVAVRLASPARSAAIGELRLAFEPAVAGMPDDPAIQFLAPAGRVLALSVEQGQEVAQLAGHLQAEFQTGTTAGRIVLTVQLGSRTEQAVFPIAPAPIVVDSVRVTRSSAALEVDLIAFDNTRSASQLTFTFYDPEGRTIEPGSFSLDAQPEFSRYFAGSQLGGLFRLRALFPVSGDSARIVGAEVGLKNDVGWTRSSRLTF